MRLSCFLIFRLPGLNIGELVEEVILLGWLWIAAVAMLGMDVDELHLLLWHQRELAEMRGQPSLLPSVRKQWPGKPLLYGTLLVMPLRTLYGVGCVFGVGRFLCNMTSVSSSLQIELGNFDLVGNNTEPMLFIREDGMRSGTCFQAEPKDQFAGEPENRRIVDFFSHHPESLHMFS